MSETRTHLVHTSTHAPTHHASHHTVCHPSHVGTHTAPTVTHAAPTSTEAGPTGFSYPTPSNVPHSSGIIMGLSLGIAFCILLLSGAVAVLVMQRRSAKGKYEERVIRSVYGSDDSKLATCPKDKEKKHRTWMGRKIVALVPGNEYGRENVV